MGDYECRPDPDLLRLILLEIERLDTTDGPLEIDDCDAETVGEHIAMLYDMGYITLGGSAADLYRTVLKLGFRLTWGGRDYLELVRDL